MKLKRIIGSYLLLLKKSVPVFSVLLKLFLLFFFYFWNISLSSSDNTPQLQKALFSETGKTDNHYGTIREIKTAQFNQMSENYSSSLDDFEHLKSAITSFMQRYDIKGGAIAIVKDERLVFTEGFGYADQESGEHARPCHLFRVASVSKLVTAVTIMKMTELNLISLDDRVFGNDGILNDPLYLEYIDKRIEDITIRHLLNHSAGWNRRYGDPMFSYQAVAKDLGADITSLEVTDIIRYSLKTRLHFTPGTRTSYSNLGYAILGEVIESVSGITYESYVRQTILEPLGITRMKIGKNLLQDRYEDEVKYYGTSYIPESLSPLFSNRSRPVAYGGNNIELLGAAGGWVASPAEIMKLIVSIDSIPDSPKILSNESIKIMTDIRQSGGHLIGWAGSDGRGNWWRTGTLSGTSALVMRQNNSVSWAIFFNSSTYRGMALPRQTAMEVQNALKKVEKWPDHNLFFDIGKNTLANRFYLDEENS